MERLERALDEGTRTSRKLLRCSSVMDFVPLVSPQYLAPTHLAPLIYELDRVPREVIELCVSAPPRHLKTSTICHWVAHMLVHNPRLKVLYACAGTDLATENVRNILRIAERAGVEIGSVRRQTHFETRAGGSVTAVGFKTQIVGRGYDVVVVDDPHRSRAEAESRASREQVVRGFISDIYTRQEPGRPTSFVVLHTRFHPDDLIGNLIRPAGEDGPPPFRWINLPAVNELDEPLAPELFSLERLRAIEARVGPYEWASQFMGKPRAEGQALFGDALLCGLHEVPTTGRYAIGVDLAHTASTRADHHAAVVMLRAPDDGARRRFYVVEVCDEQGRLTDEVRDDRVVPGFVREIERLRREYPGAPARQWIGNNEDLVIELLTTLGVPIEPKRVTRDKRARAQPFADAWGRGEVLVPRGAPWADAFCSQLAGFTGDKGGRDDMVDAAATAFDLLAASDGLSVLTPSSAPSSGGGPYRGRMTRSLGRRGVW